jgi:hypothetical protein
MLIWTTQTFTQELKPQGRNLKINVWRQSLRIKLGIPKLSTVDPEYESRRTMCFGNQNKQVNYFNKLLYPLIIGFVFTFTVSPTNRKIVETCTSKNFLAEYYHQWVNGTRRRKVVFAVSAFAWLCFWRHQRFLIQFLKVILEVEPSQWFSCVKFVTIPHQLNRFLAFGLFHSKNLLKRNSICFVLVPVSDLTQTEYQEWECVYDNRLLNNIMKYSWQIEWRISRSTNRAVKWLSSSQV